MPTLLAPRIIGRMLCAVVVDEDRLEHWLDGALTRGLDPLPGNPESAPRQLAPKLIRRKHATIGHVLARPEAPAFVALDAGARHEAADVGAIHPQHAVSVPKQRPCVLDVLAPDHRADQ